MLLGTTLHFLVSPDRTRLFAKVWSGALIALSLGGYHLRWFTAAAMAGLAAVFMRKLAAPYAIVCGLLAIGAGRRIGAAVWIVGGAFYAVYCAADVMAVSGAMQLGPNIAASSWIQWLGWPFVLQTIWVSGWTVTLPHAATPVVAVLALSGTLSTTMPAQLRLAVLSYTAIFCIVGQEFNFYWGWVTASLWSYSVMYSPDGLMTIGRALLAHSTSNGGGRQHFRASVRE